LEKKCLVSYFGSGAGLWREFRTYNLERMSNDSYGHELLAVIASVHHQGVGEPLDDGTLGFSESFGGISACGVGDVDWRADLDVIAVREEESISI
jgi:hypothetical protein